MRLIKKILLAVATCIFALGGGVVGFVCGGLMGSTTEAGLVRGCGVGIVSGVIVSLELIDSLITGCFMSKVCLILASMVNGKVFAEWVCPAVLNVYQSQTFNLSFLENEDLDLYNIDDGPRGLAPKLIDELPTFTFQQCHHIHCTICLEDSKDGEIGRELRNCGHCFHKECIDAWLELEASCPVCRQLVHSPSLVFTNIL